MSQLKELRSFVAIVSEGSLSATARRLQLPKSTLSRHLKKLESSVGQPLLKRESNRLIPTEAGRTFYHYGTRILKLAEEGREALEQLNQAVQGELRLFVDNGLIRGWLGAVLEQFMDRYPQVRITLHTYPGQDSELWRDAVFLWMGELPELPLRQECLAQLGQGIYGQRDYLARYGSPRRPEELRDHRWIDLLGGAQRNLTMTSVRGEHIDVQLPASRMQADQLVLQADAIAAGRGLGLMPHWQARMRMEYHPGCFERCLPEWEALPAPVWLAYPHGRLGRKHQAFIGHLRQSLPPAWADSGEITTQASRRPHR